ncbi:MAG: hypothetical protein LBV74_07890 [Tannerella sp.]|jgi:hypothetical protein|nr:hypothetical protein [Tannerella sp.]
MFKQLSVITYCLVFAVLCGCTNEESFKTKSFEVKMNKKGEVTALLGRGKNYFPDGQKAPLVAIRIDGIYENPSSLSFDKQANLINLHYSSSNTDILIKPEEKDVYLTFEIVDIKSDHFIELAVWGPYGTIISETVGECVGVVRDSSYAIGIQALNPKTIGGYPTTEDDIDPFFDIFATNSLVDVPDSTKVLYRGQTAKHTDFGSVLQAYCRNRANERIVPMWGHEIFLAPAYEDGGISGSKIALFGCPVGETLDYLEKIELGEDLPHPTLDGEWVKRAPEASQAYIIYPFNEQNIEEAIAFTKKTGLKYLYHGGPFETWGHFRLNPSEFPSGYDGLRQCVEKAEKEGIKLGVHTLSNFTTTNDEYVTPVPDNRLARVGSSVLSTDVDIAQTTIPVESPDFFNQMVNNNLHCVKIGNELIRYESVSESAPWTLLNCSRGAWGTQASGHSKGDTISKLLDHGYKVFLTDIDLTKEIARTLADIFNNTGIRQISFDGLEGCWSTGLGQYGLSLMTKEWYDHLLPEYRDNINDASMTTHYNWHIFTRMNWGEPWYAGFRESQLNLRLMNQDFYRRNLIPCMLGWFKLDAGTGIEDIEWLLARSAAFDAGYTLVTDKEKVEKNGQSEQIIKAIREWENARLSGAFPEALKKEMEHIANEYTLSETSATSWILQPLDVQRFKHTNIVRQPGEPVVSKWEFENQGKRQPVQFMMKTNGNISTVSLEIANYSTVRIDCNLSPDQYLKYEGGSECALYDKNWNLLKTIPLEQDKMTVPQGKTQLVFSCKFADSDHEDASVSCEVKIKKDAIPLQAVRNEKVD